MKRIVAVAVIAGGIALAPSFAAAHERFGDGLMGAAAGGLVFGPVGAVAGGLVGYTHGPTISRGLGFHHHHYRHRHYSSQDKYR